MFQPINGTRNTSILDTHLKGKNNRKATSISSCDWWFDTMIYCPPLRIFSRPAMRTDHGGMAHKYRQAHAEVNMCRMTSRRSNKTVSVHIAKAIRNKNAEEVRKKARKQAAIILFSMGER